MSIFNSIRKQPITNGNPPPQISPQASPLSVENDAVRRAEIDTEKARLLAEDAAHQASNVHVPESSQPDQPGSISVSDCDMDTAYLVEGKRMTYAGASKGFHFFTTSEGERVRLSDGVRVSEVPSMGQVNPPDAVSPTIAEAADPLPKEVIAKIEDPEIRARVDAHVLAVSRVSDDEPEVKSVGRCPNGALHISLTLDQVAAREVRCSYPTCGRMLKVTPVKVGEGIYEAQLRGHNLPKSVEVAQPSVVVKEPDAFEEAARAGRITVAAAETARDLYVKMREMGMNAPVEDVIQGVAKRMKIEPVKVPPVLSVVPAAPVVDVPPTIASEPLVASSVVAVVPPPVLETETVSFETTMEPKPRATIFFDVAVIGDPQPKPLSEYYDPIVKMMEEKSGLPDIRCAVDGDLGFGRWKGVLAALVRNRPIEEGEWLASSHDEVEMIVVSALRARVVRSVR